MVGNFVFLLMNIHVILSTAFANAHAQPQCCHERLCAYILTYWSFFPYRVDSQKWNCLVKRYVFLILIDIARLPKGIASHLPFPAFSSALDAPVKFSPASLSLMIDLSFSLLPLMLSLSCVRCLHFFCHYLTFIAHLSIFKL